MLLSPGLDVKTGTGAFMKREDEAALLGELMVDTARRMGVRAVALITGMDQPLGLKIGNALEVEEVIEVLHSKGPADLANLTVMLAGWMFHLGGRSATVEEGEQLARELLASGAALDKFRRMIELQGGDARVVDEPDRLPRAKYRADVVSTSTGYVTAMDCELIGIAGVLLGGGRQHESDNVDPAVGIVMQKKLGDPVQRGEPLCTAHFNSAEQMQAARLIIERNIQVEAVPPTRLASLIRRVIRDN